MNKKPSFKKWLIDKYGHRSDCGDDPFLSVINGVLPNNLFEDEESRINSSKFGGQGTRYNKSHIGQGIR